MTNPLSEIVAEMTKAVSRTEFSISRYQMCLWIDRLQSLAISGAGEVEAVAWEWRLRTLDGWTDWQRITHDIFLRTQYQSPDIETRALAPIDTHPVAPGAGDEADTLRYDDEGRPLCPKVGVIYPDDDGALWRFNGGDSWDEVELADGASRGAPDGFAERLHAAYYGAHPNANDLIDALVAELRTCADAQPAAPAAEVDDAMVERACDAFMEATPEAEPVRWRSMRAALVAARLPGGGEAVVGWSELGDWYNTLCHGCMYLDEGDAGNARRAFADLIAALNAIRNAQGEAETFRSLDKKSAIRIPAAPTPPASAALTESEKCDLQRCERQFADYVSGDGLSILNVCAALRRLGGVR